VDWIGIFPAGAPDNGYGSYVYTSSAASPCTLAPGPAVRATGTCGVVVPSTPGTYELRLFANNGYTRLGTSSPFTITANTATPTTLSTATPTALSTATRTATPTATATPTRTATPTAAILTSGQSASAPSPTATR
jgi:hypothetical protein